MELLRHRNEELVCGTLIKQLYVPIKLASETSYRRERLKKKTT